MNEKIETVINDLYTLDPTLREHDEHIRALVTTLIETKPHVEVDEEFLKRLRARLLARAENSQKQFSHSEWNFWLIRLVPIGAVALLLITIAPQFSQTGISPQTPSPEAGTTMMQTTPSNSSSNTHIDSFKFALPEAVAKVRMHAAQKVGILENDVIILTAYEKEWPDGCLGLGGLDESCIQVVTFGYEVTVSAKGVESVFRTNADGSLIREEK